MRQAYRRQLDGLRAIAIGLVCIEHFGGPWIRDHFPIGAGALGVHLFFVLSGFLITRNLLARLEDQPAGDVVRRFYIGRAIRLMPAYYLTLLVLFALGVPEVRDFMLWHAVYASNYLAATGGPLLVFWSLAVEEQFYLLLPALVLLSGRNAVKVAVLLIATGFLLRNLVLATPIDPWSFELSLFGNFEILGLGVLIGGLSYAAAQAGRPLQPGPVWRWTGIVCIVFQGVAWYLWGDGVVRHLTFNLSVGIFFAWLVARADADLQGPLAWFSNFSLIRFIGKISYGIYLTHVFFLGIFQSDTVISHLGVVPLWAQAVIAIALSLLVSTASWFLMESPLLRLKNRVQESPGHEPVTVGGDHAETSSLDDLAHPSTLPRQLHT
ncbi:acyltransferase family protein [Aurantimonas endophytica]|uniref:Peptidoglycan/LPS O-acetylase OafA/YrhL n=1 Tax=Aurantimonas endophytica TaxID=1522175 RepID=A0A7W6HG45_9HYPH|nr:peptidoglycan/LPS O-acetylase OafA/YrhL [Aurantimonas endophytica]MCO6405249.1 acyltransferase family protein [Aurantimonas endophytica]